MNTMWSRYSSSFSFSPSHISLLLLTIFLSLQQTKALVLRVNEPHTVVQKNLTVESVIQTAIDHLHRSPDPAFKDFALIGGELAPQAFGTGPLRLSANISDFHSISLFILLAGKPDIYILENRYPEHWDQWRFTNPTRGALILGHSSITPSSKEKGISWRLVQEKMPVEKADRLLKAAGFRGRYLSVELDHLPKAHLRWLFREIEISGKPHSYVGVDILTGEVKLLPEESLEDKKSRNGSLTFGRV